MNMMKGGEIFIPKIPSIKIINLAEYLAPKIKTKIVGIRPGEKLHEVLCPVDDSHLILEFNKYYIIKPSIDIFRKINFKKNIKGEIGKKVNQNFEYNSLNNKEWLNKSSLIKLINNN
tara:strand:+ start:35 stop:385 length:351 start_codon:yes stop_codon:yes gene_type:complete